MNATLSNDEDTTQMTYFVKFSWLASLNGNKLFPLCFQTHLCNIVIVLYFDFHMTFSS